MIDWISVKDKLPPWDIAFLAYYGFDNDNNIFVIKFYSYHYPGTQFIDVIKLHKITHWCSITHPLKNSEPLCDTKLSKENRDSIYSYSILLRRLYSSISEMKYELKIKNRQPIIIDKESLTYRPSVFFNIGIWLIGISSVINLIVHFIK